MMDLKKIYHSVVNDTKNRDGTLSILVDLTVKKPSEAELARLKQKGLLVDRVIGNKITGRILPKQLKELEKDELIREVEKSTKLDLH